MITSQICCSPVQQQVEERGGMKRKLEDSSVPISSVPIFSFDLPEDAVDIILSELDQKTLKIFDIVCKAALLQTERIWKKWRERDYLNFSWDSIPSDLANHHKWSYLLNEAIVTSLDKIGMWGLRDSPEEANDVYKSYEHVAKRFNEFHYFFNVVLCSRQFCDDCFFNVVLCSRQFCDEQNVETIIRIADEKKSGGELALKALISEADCEDEGDVVRNFLNGIEKNATFLAEFWIEKGDVDGALEFRNDSFAEELIEYKDGKAKIFSKKINNEHELIAIKAAEKNDYRAMIKLLSYQSNEWIWHLISDEIKLPSFVWLEAARQNNKSSGDILLLYAKAFETNPLDSVIPDYLWDEAIDRILLRKLEDSSEYSWFNSKDPEDPLEPEALITFNEAMKKNSELRDKFWNNNATDELRIIKEILESKISTAG